MTSILYVEDNEDNIYMLSKRLKKKGFEITIAKDGEEGLKAARDLKPDLILMDLSLPLLDGWEATRILKSEPETKLIPIIALSAHAMQEHKDKALEEVVMITILNQLILQDYYQKLIISSNKLYA